MHKPETTWQVDPRVRFRRMFDEAVVIHQEKAEALVLNETGTTFLELCDGQRSVEQIIRLMADQYDTSGEELRNDIRQFIEDLSSGGIISRVAEAPE